MDTNTILDTGNTAWMIVSTILVLLMTIPGIALFYGGLVRQKKRVERHHAVCGDSRGGEHLMGGFRLQLGVRDKPDRQRERLGMAGRRVRQGDACAA